ncbi:MAG: uroporphyrinogen-III synthase [Bacteroidaceae bacterium]|nr:uroporphyrinogen-III synthase [Bacteroidaceae bacterium]
MMAPKILISQPKPQTAKSPYFDIAEKYGIDMVFRPFIKIEKMSAKDFRQQKVSIPGHTAIVFTSRHAIDHFFDLVKELRVVIKEDMKYFCKSEQVALYIQKYVQYRKRKVFFPLSGKVSDLIPIMEKHKTENYFVPQSSAHNDEMKNMLDAAGLKHDEAVMYYTVSNDFTPDEPFDYNMLVFFSPEGIHSLVKNFPNFDQGKVAIACLGQKTIEAAEEAGLRVDMKPTPELRSVPAIIEDFIKHHSKEEIAPKETASDKKKTAPAKKKPAAKKPAATKTTKAKTTAKKA